MKVLVAEDNADSRRLLKKQLQAFGHDVVDTINGTEALARAMVEPPDILVTDILMPEMDGYQLCYIWKQDEQLLGIPLVFYSATYTSAEDEKFALSLGADAFIRKPAEPEVFLRTLSSVLEKARSGNLNRPRADPPELLSYLKEYNKRLLNKLNKKVSQLEEEIGHRKQAEEASRQKEQQFRELANSITDIFFALDKDLRYTYWNKAIEKFTGIPEKDALAKRVDEIFPESLGRASTEQVYREVLETKESRFFITDIPFDGSLRITEISVYPSTEGLSVFAKDITELRKLQEEQSKMAKLESIGILAGGIAHDFNNLLTSIMGNIGLARRYVAPTSKAYEMLDEAERASAKAKDLTRQLLTFSKGGAPVKETAVVSELIKETASFVLHGSDVRLEFSIPENLWAVEIDKGQISQVIQNIVINADEAMPTGGTLEISAENQVIVKKGELPVPPGNYIHLSIKDQGIGMSRDHLARIFEPYYTTKQKGSGLGLAVAYSIIVNHSGYITAESIQNVGTTFHIYLPASGRPAPPVKEHLVEKPVRGEGRILVMDDEEDIRNMLHKMLEFVGYRAEQAKDGLEAIEMYQKGRETGKPFVAVILDLTVPGGMGGKDVIKKLREIDPDVKAIVSSGYTTDPIMSEYREHGFKAVVSKPYSISKMEETLHKVLTEK
jgi:two-component system, cell cycle sensor histidine kinase and response regulator CckA